MTEKSQAAKQKIPKQKNAWTTFKIYFNLKFSLFFMGLFDTPFFVPPLYNICGQQQNASKMFTYSSSVVKVIHQKYWTWVNMTGSKKPGYQTKNHETKKFKNSTKIYYDLKFSVFFLGLLHKFFYWCKKLHLIVS